MAKKPKEHLAGSWTTESGDLTFKVHKFKDGSANELIVEEDNGDAVYMVLLGISRLEVDEVIKILESAKQFLPIVPPTEGEPAEDDEEPAEEEEEDDEEEESEEEESEEDEVAR